MLDDDLTGCGTQPDHAATMAVDAGAGPHMCQYADRLSAAERRADELRAMAARCARGECHDDALSRAEAAEAKLARVREEYEAWTTEGLGHVDGIEKTNWPDAWAAVGAALRQAWRVS